jgi:autotransporter-associated beta strand protein
MKFPGHCCRPAAVVILVGSIALLLSAREAKAQSGSSVSYTTAGSIYSQNFDGLPATGTPASTGIFAFGDTSGIDATGMAGWYGEAVTANKYATGPGTGTVTTGGFYGYSVAGAQPVTNIALGMQTASGSGNEIFGLELVNNTGTTLTSFTIDYDAETWHFGTATTAKTLQFGYVVGGGSTLPTISSAGTVTPASGAYVEDAALNYTVAGTGTAGAVDGHATANNTVETATISSIAWASGTTLWLTWDFGTDSAQSPGLAIDNLTFSALGGGTLPANVVWAVNNGVGTWDTTTGNWTGGNPTANLYKTGDNATFNDTHSGAAGGTVTIQAGGVSPGSTTVNTAGTYTFQNTGGDTNGISGTGSLTILGAGKVILTSPNTYSGGTIVSNGTLQISADNQLGASGGTLSIDNATLSITSSITGMNRSLTLGVDGETIATNGNNLANAGATNINGTLTTTGAGNVAFNGAVTFGATSGSLSISAGGSVTLGQLTGTISFGDGASINGNLNIGVAGSSTATRVNFDNGGSSLGVTGIGNINILSTGTSITNAGSTTGDTVSTNIVLNSGGSPFTKGNVAQATYVPGTFVTTIGGTTADFGLTVNSVISGASDVNIAGGGGATTGGGSGSITLGGQSTYTGTTTVNLKSGTVTLGVNNALPVTTDLIFGTESDASGNLTFDLGGNNQQIASLSVGTGFGTGAAFTIINGGGVNGTNSILTISGSTTPATDFSGVISGAIYGISLVKGGSNTLGLSGINTYSGTTTVTGGTLLLDFSPSTAPTSNILFSGVTGSVLSIGGATLNLTGGSGMSDNQQLYGLNVSPGGSTIFLNQNGAASLSLAIGALTQTPGGVVNFSVIPSASGVVATTTNSNVNGILGTWATVGSGTTLAYATQTGSGNQIGAFTGTAAATAAALTDTTGTVNYDLTTASGTAPATFSANTIRYLGAGGTTSPGATSFTVNGLMNGGSGLWTIATHAIIIGANKELDVISNSQGIAISSVIKDNGGGASIVTTSGTGTVTLSGANTYTGGTFLDGGVLSLGVAQNGTVSGPLGASGLISFGGGTLQFSSTNTNATDYSSRFSTAANQEVSIDTNSQNVTFGTALTSVGGSLNKTGLGNLTLSTTNTYSGGTTIQGGALIVGGSISGSTTVQNGGTLGGIGSGGNVEVQSGGKLEPGLTTSGPAVGSFTASSLLWDGGGKLLFELSTTNNTSDHLSLGTGVLAQGASGQYAFDFLGGGKAGQTYDLINFGSTTYSSASLFTATDLAAGLTGNFVLSGSELDVQILAVPEPSAWGALAWGAGLIIGFRRFRRWASGGLRQTAKAAGN